jgi:hypothetical protein
LLRRTENKPATNVTHGWLEHGLAMPFRKAQGTLSASSAIFCSKYAPYPETSTKPRAHPSGPASLPKGTPNRPLSSRNQAFASSTPACRSSNCHATRPSSTSLTNLPPPADPTDPEPHSHPNKGAANGRSTTPCPPQSRKRGILFDHRPSQERQIIVITIVLAVLLGLYHATWIAANAFLLELVELRVPTAAEWTRS